MIPLLLRFLLFALVAWFIYYVVRSILGGSRTQGQGRPGLFGSALKCSGCRHFRGREDDGVFCGSGDFEKYKTFEDVEHCLDYARPG